VLGSGESNLLPLPGFHSLIDSFPSPRREGQRGVLHGGCATGSSRRVQLNESLPPSFPSLSFPLTSSVSVGADHFGHCLVCAIFFFFPRLPSVGQAKRGV